MLLLIGDAVLLPKSLIYLTSFQTPSFNIVTMSTLMPFRLVVEQQHPGYKAFSSRRMYLYVVRTSSFKGVKR